MDDITVSPWYWPFTIFSRQNHKSIWWWFVCFDFWGFCPQLIICWQAGIPGTDYTSEHCSWMQYIVQQNIVQQNIVQQNIVPIAIHCPPMVSLYTAVESPQTSSWSPNPTDLYFWYLFDTCQQTTTKDIAGRSATKPGHYWAAQLSQIIIPVLSVNKQTSVISKLKAVLSENSKQCYQKTSKPVLSANSKHGFLSNPTGL